MTFYATQGQSHTHRINGVTVDCDSLVEIDADSYDQAYSFCNRIFKGKWCGLYETPEFAWYSRGVVLKLRALEELDGLERE